MKLFYRLVALAALAAASPAVAQWQTPDHSVPIGRGAGATGFKNSSPGAAGSVLTSNGVSADPSFQSISGVTPPPCTNAASAGFVGDGIALNDTAFNNWWNTGARCLDFGIGKFAFGSKISKTLAPNAQTLNVSSGSYNSTSGLVTLTLSAAATFPAGSSITVWGTTGTGAFASLNGTFTAASVSGTTLTYQAQAGLSATTITGGGFSGGNRGSLTIKGAGSNLTTLYWPGANCGMQITSGGQNGAFGSSFHIRDMTISTGAMNCGTALDLQGYPYTFGSPPTSDILNVEIQGDDYLPPNHGDQYWATAVNINCWSNANLFNVNTYGNFVAPVGVGLKYGCNQGSGNYAVILNVGQSSFNGHVYGAFLQSWWQGVTFNQVNFNSIPGGPTSGILQAGGSAGVLSGLTIQASQFGGTDNAISLSPTTGSAIADVQLLNNIVYVSPNNAQGISVGTSTNLSPLVTIADNTLIGNASATGTYGIVVSATQGAVTGNIGKGSAVGIAIGANSSSLAVTSNPTSATALALANNGCTNCFIANNPGINPLGVTSSITVGASPATICAGSSSETHYFLQGATNTATVQLVAPAGPTIGTMSSPTIPVVTNLGPNECEGVTWTTTAPTYSKSVH